MDIKNPILRGFNPDPSICRVEDDFYIANSTFEWYGGVQIHHSRDLTNWRLLTHPLDRYELLDLRGDSCCGGIWAPCLTHADGLFWLIYTDVKTTHWPLLDARNYLTTATSIAGPWSAPVHLNNSGFDPSLFHDEDGRKWLVNMVLDHRKNRNWFGGILLQEYSVKEKKLIGDVKNIFKGTSLGCTEGPHLYKRNGWYYLLTAEGGTGYEHAVTMARSRTIDGPYEVDPQNPVLTSRYDSALPLQKAGHASIVETKGGEWYMVHLCSRPVGEHRRCILGRETAIQKCEWTDEGWFRLADGSNTPKVSTPAPDLPAHPFDVESVRDDFNSPTLSVHFSTLRSVPEASWLSLTERPGHLRLRGRETPQSRFEHSLVGRRVQALHCEAMTRVEFRPQHHQHMAGLTAWYSENTYYMLLLSRDENLGTSLYIGSCDQGGYHEPMNGEAEVIPANVPVWMKVTFNGEELQFHYSLDGKEWIAIGPVLDATRLSDDYQKNWGFTGAFVGMCAYDLSGMREKADFDFFEYVEKE